MHISMHMTLIEYQSQRDYARDGTEYANHSDCNRKRSNMYHLPREKFPARAEYTPPFRCRGMPGNRLFKPSPAIDKAKDMAAGFLPLLYQIRQRKSTIKVRRNRDSYRANFLQNKFLTEQISHRANLRVCLSKSS